MFYGWYFVFYRLEIFWYLFQQILVIVGRSARGILRHAVHRNWKWWKVSNIQVSFWQQHAFCNTIPNFVKSLFIYSAQDWGMINHIFYAGLRSDMMSALAPESNSTTGGLFINSCYAHCQTTVQVLWHSRNSPRLNSRVRPSLPLVLGDYISYLQSSITYKRKLVTWQTIAEAAGDWFFDRSAVKYIDCPYPCDSTCNNNFYRWSQITY